MRKFSKCSKKISRYCGIKYVVEWRTIKYPRLEFSTPILHLILPPHIKDPEVVLDARKNWLLKKHAMINTALERHPELIKRCFVLGTPYSEDTRDIEQTRKKFRRMLRQHLRSLVISFSTELGVDVNKIFIKCQRTKWASISTKKNLSFNLKMLALPVHLIQYLVYHELLHLKEKKHNRNFVRMLKKKFPNFVELEKELFAYWFALEMNRTWATILGRRNA